MPKAITRSIERDHYITAQAFYVAIKALKAVKPDYLVEHSNIADMELILDTAYPSYKRVFEAQDALNPVKGDA
jgi:hypothetical protein